MNERDRFLQSLKNLNSIAWINQYFNLLKKLFVDLNLENNDPRLALSLNSDTTMPVNLGTRYVLQPYPDEFIGCIVPTEFEETAVNGTSVYQFSPNSRRDAKFIEMPFGASCPMSTSLYDTWLQTCSRVLEQSTKSPFRKFHTDLIYHFTMEPAVREEILHDL